MEFAVIQTGGKQYKVSSGQEIKIEKLVKSDTKNVGKTGKIPEADYKEGDKIVFDQVLLVDNGTDTTIGTPFIDKAKVTGTITKIARAHKVVVIRFKQKSRYFKKNGHRQPYFQVKIGEVK